MGEILQIAATKVGYYSKIEVERSGIWEWIVRLSEVWTEGGRDESSRKD